MVRLAVFASGGGTNFQALIDAVAEGRLEAQLALLVIDREQAYAAKRAEAAGIPVEYIGRKRFTDRESQEQFLLGCLEEKGIEAIVLAGYLGIVQEAVVKAYPNRIVNIHPSLIPKFCGKGFYGLKVHEAVIAAGETISGASVHYVDEGIDTGAVIQQETVPVLPDDTPETLQRRVLEVEHRLLVSTVQRCVKEWGTK